jgi:hypothetical protein
VRCIFCRATSDNSKSVEHILPESLGNVEHTLPPGIVCDKCNNYFARKIEKPLLESQYFLYARFENIIPSKKGRVPVVQGLIPQARSVVDVAIGEEGLTVLIDPEDVSRFLESTKTKEGTLYILHPTKPEGVEHLLSRFLGKVAIEALAHRVLEMPEALEVDVIDNEALDPLRAYVRRGSLKVTWLFLQRTIYPADAVFYDEEENVHYDIPHEFTLLYTAKKELFLILAIFGIEYALNMGAPEIDGYVEWVNQNDDKSPLYMNGVDYSFTRGGLAGLDRGSIISLYTSK